MCSNLRRGDENQTDPVILSLQGTSLEYVEWAIPRHNTIQSADRMRLAHVLDKANNFTTTDRIALALVFALCTSTCWSQRYTIGA